MLIPKKVKHRKWQKGRSKNRQIDTRGTHLSFGAFGLQALSNAWVTSRQIEASRRAIVNYLKKGGKLWIRIFPDKPVTQRPPEVTMGGGKGNVEFYVFPVRKGRVLFEIDGVSEEIARVALSRANDKMPLKTKFIKAI
jgi:large subunit ribosomal protein L16